MSNLLDAGNGKCKGKNKGNGKKGNQHSCCNIQDMPKEELSKNEIETINHMREEEKLAYDVYTAFNQKWDMRIFSNIRKAEKRHLNTMGDIIEKYELEDPVKDLPPGKFNDPEMQKVYDSFIERGMKSKQEALLVGAEIEDLDINDIRVNFSKLDNLDLKTVLSNLERGSENHLRAFNRNLKNYDMVYEPKHISKEDFDKIISSGNKRGRRY